MKIKEIRELSADELKARRSELGQNSFQLRLQKKLGQLENPSQIRAVRREIARIETVLAERSHKGSQETAKAS